MQRPLSLITLPLIAFLMLPGCRDDTAASDPDPGVIPVPEVEDDPSQVPVGDTCGAQDWAEFIGRNVDALDGTALPDRARIIGPGTVVTMDYLPQRLNIKHDEAGVITDVDCG